MKFIEQYHKLMSKTKWRRIILSIFGLILWCIIVLPLILTYKKEAIQDYSYNHIPGSQPKTYDSAEDSLITAQNNTDIISFHLVIQSVDAGSKTINIYLNLEVFGRYAESDSGKFKETVTCNLHFQKFQIQKGTLANSVSLKVPMFLGSLRDYPFESFIARFPLSCSDFEKNLIDISVTSERTLQIYSATFTVAKILDLPVEEREYFNGTTTSNQILGIVVQLSHPFSTKLFVIFLCLVMWGLAIAYSIVILHFLISRKEIPPPIISIGVAMLFALPNLRSAQPGVPVIGTLSDVAAFFWCMAIVAFSTMVGLFSFGLRWRPRERV